MVKEPDIYYSWENYDELHRWISYWYQIQAVARTQAQSVLEIGCGSGVFSRYLRENLGLNVTTFDADESRVPDVTGDVRKITSHFEAQAFDCVCAFQVLEHIPYEHFEETLPKLSRISRRNVIISLPYWGYFLQFRIRLIKLNWTLAFSRKITRPFELKNHDQHFWEIGTKKYPLKRVYNSISSHMTINRDYFCPDYAYHYFFECEV